MQKKKVIKLKALKEIPEFKSENDEREFWSKHNSTEYIDWDQAEEVIFPNLKPTTESISIRTPSYLLARIKELANAQDVPYQSLMKTYLAEKVEEKLKKFSSK